MQDLRVGRGIFKQFFEEVLRVLVSTFFSLPLPPVFGDSGFAFGDENGDSSFVLRGDGGHDALPTGGDGVSGSSWLSRALWIPGSKRGGRSESLVGCNRGEAVGEGDGLRPSHPGTWTSNEKL